MNIPALLAEALNSPVDIIGIATLMEGEWSASIARQRQRYLAILEQNIHQDHPYALDASLAIAAQVTFEKIWKGRAKELRESTTLLHSLLGTRFTLEDILDHVKEYPKNIPKIVVDRICYYTVKTVVEVFATPEEEEEVTSITSQVYDSLMSTLPLGEE